MSDSDIYALIVSVVVGTIVAIIYGIVHLPFLPFLAGGAMLYYYAPSKRLWLHKYFRPFTMGDCFYTAIAYIVFGAVVIGTVNRNTILTGNLVPFTLDAVGDTLAIAKEHWFWNLILFQYTADKLNIKVVDNCASMMNDAIVSKDGQVQSTARMFDGDTSLLGSLFFGAFSINDEAGKHVYSAYLSDGKAVAAQAFFPGILVSMTLFDANHQPFAYVKGDTFIYDDITITLANGVDVWKIQRNELSFRKPIVITKLSAEADTLELRYVVAFVGKLFFVQQHPTLHTNSDGSQSLGWEESHDGCSYFVILCWCLIVASIISLGVMVYIWATKEKWEGYPLFPNPYPANMLLHTPVLKNAWEPTSWKV